ncbi:MAG: hypothetical protein AB1333_00675 [Patescibacteria group bacterium]
MSLEELEKQLYSAQQKQQKGGGGEIKKEVPIVEEKKEPTPTQSSWREEDMKDFGVEGKKKNRFKRFFFVGGTIIILISIVVGGGFFFLKYLSTPKDVSIEIYSQGNIPRGVPFEVTVQLTNEINNFLEDAKVILTLTPGIISLEGGDGTNRNMLVDTVGNIGGGSLTKRTFKLLSVGDVNSVQKITAELSYRTGGKALFTVDTSKDISIASPAIILSIKKPEQIIAGSKFDLEVNYENTSSFDFSDVVLEAKYPASFLFDSASIPPASLNNYWRLGELKSGSKGSIQIKGALNSLEKEASNIPFLISADFGERNYLIDEQLATLSISPAPIFVEITPNGKSDYIAKMGDEVTYVINYRNDSGIDLSDVVLKTQFVGDLFDFTTLRTNGGFNSLTGTVTWTAANIPGLRVLEKSASGQAEVRIKLNPYYQIKRSSDKNFVLRATAEINSPSVPHYITAEKTSTVVVKETKVMGVASVDAQALYRDPGAGIVNSGTFPPKVNRPTQFSVHWILKNYLTDIKDVEVRASLGREVKWVSAVKSNIESSPTYNERTQEVIWTIDKISAASGILSDPIEAIFKVELTPNVTEVGQYKDILGKTTLTATDDFTGVDMVSYDNPLTTNLTDDKTVQQENGRVVQ